MARDPKRIDRMVGLLRQRWHEAPDLRLGQLVVNVAARSGVSAFYLEDYSMELHLSEPWPELPRALYLEDAPTPQEGPQQ
jgi:hypothetical protein